MIPLYRSNTYRAEAETAIGKITLTDDRKTAIICRDLAFYPGGGGQPAETGTVVLRGETYPVQTLLKQQGDVLVVLAEYVPFHEELRKGEPVIQKVDMDFRLRASKMHSIQHTLGAAARLTIPNHETLGMEIVNDLSQCEMRFNTDQMITDSMIEEIAGLARTAIAWNLPIRTEINESVEVVRSKYHDAFRISPALTEWRSNRLRTVIIGDETSPIQDVCLCGGTHIQSLSEANNFEITRFGRDDQNGENYIVFTLA